MQDFDRPPSYDINSTSPFECTLIPDSCPSPAGCFLVYNSSGSLVQTYCDCLSYYGYRGYPTCSTPSATTIALFCFFSVFILFLFLSFLLEARIFFCFCKKKIRQVKNLKISLSFLTIVGSLVLSLLVMVVAILHLVGISNPSRVSSFGNGLRVTFIHPQRNFVAGVSLILVLALTTIHSGTFMEIAYHSRILRRANEKDLCFVYKSTAILCTILLFVNILLLGISMLFAAYCFLLSVYSCFFLLFLYASNWAINGIKSRSLQYERNHEFQDVVTTIRIAEVWIGSGYLFAIIGTIINILTPIQAHSKIWMISGPVLSLLGFGLIITGFTRYGNRTINLSSRHQQTYPFPDPEALSSREVRDMDNQKGQLARN